jgi:hypothetical protein
MVAMEDLDKAEVDALIATTFRELKKAVNNYSKGSIELYSSTLRALVPLRELVVKDENDDA